MKEEIISVEGLRKTYSTGLVTFEALKGVDFKVYQGEFVAIMGNSGSGKSTLMNIIGCLDVATSGKYFLGGQDISLCKENQLNVVRCEKIGFVFQSFNLLPKLSVLQNVELPMVYRGKKAHERKVKAIELLEMVGLGDKLKNKPTELSGGQRQRVAIARALINDPELILADEPTGSLDTNTAQNIMNIFKELNKSGKTIIIVTHNMELAKETQKCVKIKDGLIYKV